MNTHRAYMGADNTVTCWVRDEAGRVDLTAATLLEVSLYPYTINHQIHELPAVQATAVSPVTFEVTDDFSDKNLAPGLFRFVIEADNVAVYHGLLELV